MKEYADNILDLMDPNYSLIKHRLYRQHTTFYIPGIVKNIENIGRPMEKTLIIDNLPENFKLQPNNGLPIKTWIDDILDTQLFDLMRILEDIIKYKVEDIRSVIKKINENYQQYKTKNENNPYSESDISTLI